MLKIAKRFVTVVLCFCVLVPVDLRASQIVTPQDLHKDLQKEWIEREQNLATLQGLLSSPEAAQLIKQSGANYQKVMQALPQLDDQELARLATQTRVAQANFAAGMSDREMINLLIIVLLVVAIVAIIVAVAD
jgi:hypothetical protein